MDFATSLNFTSANEDGSTELAALRLSSDDDVLCLTASGTRPLDLLLGDPGRIVALDTNPAQNMLLRLKMAALRNLGDDAYLAYLGVVPHTDRWSLHEEVETALPPEDRAYWQARADTIARGIWFSGRWERVLRLGASGLHLWRGGVIARIFSADRVEEQEALWREHFDGPAWRTVLRILAWRWVWLHLVGEPGGAYLPPSKAAAELIADRLLAASGEFAFADSDFLTLMFKGAPNPHGALPLHMRPGNLDIVRSRLDRLTVADGDLRNLAAERRFTAYSLSDFGSYTDAESYAACWRGISRSAVVGARFCERVLLNELPLPASAILDAKRSAALSRIDKAAIYDVRAGTISHAS